MPTANAVAVQLRKLADSLDKNPEAEIVKPTIFFSHAYRGVGAKGWFIALVKSLPRPIKKSDGYYHDEVIVEYNDPALCINSSIPKSLTCTLVHAAIPAEYSCDPILSLEEESNLEVA